MKKMIRNESGKNENVEEICDVSSDIDMETLKINESEVKTDKTIKTKKTRVRKGKNKFKSSKKKNDQDQDQDQNVTENMNTSNTQESVENVEEEEEEEEEYTCLQKWKIARKRYDDLMANNEEIKKIVNEKLMGEEEFESYYYANFELFGIQDVSKERVLSCLIEKLTGTAMFFVLHRRRINKLKKLNEIFKKECEENDSNVSISISEDMNHHKKKCVKFAEKLYTIESYPKLTDK